MAKVKRSYLDRLSFWCPGCTMIHEVQPATAPFHDGGWTWNGSHGAPTLSPSILIEGNADRPTCYSNVIDGQIEFLAESTHELAGQTVELPEWTGS
jgi:hypothetical protein